MRFRFIGASVLALASSTIAVGIDPTDGFDEINSPSQDEKVLAGKPFKVKWNNPAPYTDGQIYIQLLSGPSFDKLQVKSDKLATLNNNEKQYTWNVDSSLGDEALYGLRFVLEQDNNIVQYSQRFTIVKAEDDSGSSTVTMTSSQGVKTVTLSSTSAATTTTSSILASTTTTNTTTNTSFVMTISNAAYNTTSSDALYTTIARNTTTLAPTAHSKTSSIATTTTKTKATGITSPSVKPSNGAVRAAGSVAAFGGLVAALFAL